MDKIHNIYSIRQIGNGYLVTIAEDKTVETCDTSYIDALTRLISHLANALEKVSGSLEQTTKEEK